MIVVATLRTHDQADIVEASVAFHLAMGAAVVIATDHRSTDGTREILRTYEREGALVLFEEDGPEIKGSEWRTRAARLAKSEFGADWVFSADGDEFWWPRGGTYGEVLTHVPSRYGVVSAPVRPFYPRPDDDRSFDERMTARCAARAPVNDTGTTYRPDKKILHRGDATVVVQRGNHSLVGGPAFALLPHWHPVEVLHFPVRSARQHEQKNVTWFTYHATASATGGSSRGDYSEVHALSERGELDAYYRSLEVDDAVLQQGLAEGSIEVDTRLRDVLRQLRLPDDESSPRRYRLPVELDRPLVVPVPTPAEDASYACDVAVLVEADLVRLHRDLDRLEQRLGRLAVAEPR